MHVREHEIGPSSFVTEIVNRDYRTADVFRRYGIDYCCGAKWSLETICEMKGVDLFELLHELKESTRTIQLYNGLPFREWDVDFLADYIIRVHHYYLRNRLPRVQEMLRKFVSEHEKKYAYLPELESTFLQLSNDMLPHLEQEEEIIFPYIRQIAHAFESSESYASLLVRTLRKPVEQVMKQEHVFLEKLLQKMRRLTHDYTPPERACTSHKVVFHMLKEVDNDLVQHKFLENEVLFPRAIEMERILLSRND